MLYHCNKIGDEFHDILQCKTLSNLQSQYFYLATEYCSSPNTFHEIMSSYNYTKLRNLCLLITKIDQIVPPPMYFFFTFTTTCILYICKYLMFCSCTSCSTIVQFLSENKLNYIKNNQLLSKFQSGFQPVDSTFN